MQNSDRNLWKVFIQGSFAPKTPNFEGANRYLTQSRLQVKGRQRSRNFGRDRLSGCEMEGSKVSLTPGFFVSNTRSLFRNFATGDFRQIWPWHVNRGWNADFGHKIMKSVHSGVICPQNPKLWGGQTVTSLRAGYRSRDAVRYCLLHIVVQRPESFRGRVMFYYVRLWSYGVSKLPNFRILTYFSPTKPLKRTFRWQAYCPGVTSQNASDFFHVVDEGPKGCLPAA